MHTPVLFEHPLDEKMRAWLCIGFLIQQMALHPVIATHADTLHFFRNASDLSDMLERGEVRADLVKELERQRRKLQSWVEVPGVDQERVNELRQQPKQPSNTPTAALRTGQFLCENRLIALVHQRLSIPGGCCSFDLLTPHIWLHILQAHRDEQVASWLASLNPLIQSLNLALDLIRNSTLFHRQTGLSDFYQDNSENADLLRLCLDLAHWLYPQISGHKGRSTIRFLPLDSEYGIVPEHFDFKLVRC